MELQKIETVTIKGANGVTIEPGMLVMYNTKNDDTSRVAKFLGLVKGLMRFEAMATEYVYDVKPSTINDLFYVEAIRF